MCGVEGSRKVRMFFGGLWPGQKQSKTGLMPSLHVHGTREYVFLGVVYLKYLNSQLNANNSYP